LTLSLINTCTGRSLLEETSLKHKVQGVTAVDQAVFNVTRKDFVVRLAYGAVSSVDSLCGIFFKSSFNLINSKAPREGQWSGMQVAMKVVV
jgi:hypothetical protein